MRRIFVVGCPRSGTTVVQAMLTSMPGVTSFGETNYVLRLLGQFNRWLDKDPAAQRKWRNRLYLARGKTHKEMQRCLDSAFARVEDAPRLRRQLSGRGYLREFRRALDEAALQQACTCWVEKTPDHLAYVDVMAREIPQAHFLHVLRHGEDVLASAIDGQMRYNEHAVFEGSIPHWVLRWNRAAEVHVRLARHARHTVLPYECLFTAPGQVRRLLCELAGTGLRSAGQAEGNITQIADLEEEPWKRGSVDGILQPPTRKFERVFGPDTRGWIRGQLADYRQTIAAIAAAQPELPWVAGAASALHDSRAPARHA